MVKVAVPGGSGGIGRALFEALKEKKTHEFVILSQKVGDISFCSLPPPRICSSHRLEQSRPQSLKQRNEQRSSR
jgi:hypothetical protein